MTAEEKDEVIDTFICIGEKFLKENKHFHLEPILARDTIQAIKELEKENAELQARVIYLQSIIEKMIRCENCKFYLNCEYLCENYEEWELDDNE